MSTTFKRFQILTTLFFMLGLAFSFSACEDPPGGDPCASVTCINGECLVSATGDPFCNCDPGFSGPNCETPDCTMDCGPNGNCITDAGGNESCECDPGFSGPNCETFDPCFNVQCPPNSTCEADAGEAFCICDDGYEGEQCDIEIRGKFLGTFTSNVKYADGFEFNGDAGSVTVTTDDNAVDQFFINNFEDGILPVGEGFGLLCRTAPIDQNANTFEILDVPNHTRNFIIDGVSYRNRYSSVGFGTISLDTGRIAITVLIESLDDAGNVESAEEVVLTLAPF